jgi:hypothetical protein
VPHNPDQNSLEAADIRVRLTFEFVGLTFTPLTSGLKTILQVNTMVPVVGIYSVVISQGPFASHFCAFQFDID